MGATNNYGMPKRWEDSVGWESHYERYYPAGDYKDNPSCGNSIYNIDRIVSFMREKGWRRVWVPGCGFSALGRLMAHLGFEAHATDFAPTAIEFQKSPYNDVPRHFSDNESEVIGGKLICAVHDFRKPYLAEYFDVVLNVKALQGFTRETMKLVAGSHFQALKPGGYGYFEHRSVSPNRQDMIERSLAKAGFYIPFHKLTCAYRRRLRDAKIPYIFMVGFPAVSNWQNYESQDELQRRRKQLRAIRDEYVAKMKALYEAGHEAEPANARHAVMIYGTG